MGKNKAICNHNECAISQLNGFITNRVWLGQSTPVLHNLTRALLATFKKSVYPERDFEDQLIKKRKKEKNIVFFM